MLWPDLRGLKKGSAVTELLLLRAICPAKPPTRTPEVFRLEFSDALQPPRRRATAAGERGPPSDRTVQDVQLPSQLWIKRVAQTITEQIDAQNSDHDRQAWKRGEPPCLAQVDASGTQYRPPLWRGWLGAEAKKAQAGCRQNGRGDPKRG